MKSPEFAPQPPRGGRFMLAGVCLRDHRHLPLDTQKIYFSLFKTLTGRISCLPSRPEGKFVFPGHV